MEISKLIHERALDVTSQLTGYPRDRIAEAAAEGRSFEDTGLRNEYECVRNALVEVAKAAAAAPWAV